MRIVLILLSFLSLNCFAKDIYYWSIIPPLKKNADSDVGLRSVVISYDLDEPFLASGHAIFGSLIQERGEWKYVFSSILNFAIKSEWETLPSNWKHKGIEFKYYGVLDYHPFNGREVHQVEVVNTRQRILFSFDGGILAFSSQASQNVMYSTYNNYGVLGNQEGEDSLKSSGPD